VVGLRVIHGDEQPLRMSQRWYNGKRREAKCFQE
jgi:hypothetical protein